jgi:hypothetical protein
MVTAEPSWGPMKLTSSAMATTLTRGPAAILAASMLGLIPSANRMVAIGSPCRTPVMDMMVAARSPKESKMRNSVAWEYAKWARRHIGAKAG